MLFKKCKVWVFKESVVCMYCNVRYKDKRMKKLEGESGGSGNGGNKDKIGRFRI